MEGQILTLAELLTQLRQKLREQRPLIHFITNLVTMQMVADATLALGALPVMALSPAEVAEMVASAQALVLNTGTPSPERVSAMLKAGEKAGELGIPILLDPVGAGATSFRLELNQRLLAELPITVLKGNRGEIAALLGWEGELKGVETVGEPDDAALVALEAARTFGVVVAVTGRRDFISDGHRVMCVENGHPMLRSISGAGCMAGAVIGAFLALGESPLEATVAGLAFFGLAGEKAASSASAPGSFKAALLDALSNLSEEEIKRGLKVKEEPVMRPKMPLDLTLYVITDAQLAGGRSLIEVVEAAIRGGATVIQYREKQAPTRRMVEEARLLRTLCKAKGVPFIVNDRVDVALAVDADGVHLGDDDMPVSIARRLLGPGKIIGASADTVEKALFYASEGADYLGVGSIYVTTTKPDAGPPIGVEGLVRIIQAVSIPVVAIGGINEDNVAQVIEAGAAGAAVVSAVMAARDVARAASRLRKRIEEARRR